MPSFSFYHLSKSTLEEALPKIMEKLLAAEGRAVLLFQNKEILKRIDEVLWSVGGTRFIPHCREDENDKDQNPVYLTTTEENPNNSNFLVLIAAVQTEYFNKFEKNIIIFSNYDDNELNSARNLWKKLKSEGNFELKYFLQDDKGNWAMKE
jgi:DNA polymerase-3 subunit chi